jgi:superfamily I DNA/RNA helicase
MIFSDHPATCVVAGAGSGKSTTLILLRSVYAFLFKDSIK